MKTGLAARFQEQQTIDRLKDSNRRLQRQLAEALARRRELVEAVYKGAYDAAATLDLPPVAVPKRDRRGTLPEVAIACLSDWQLAKVTPTYNSTICAQRVDLYADKVIELSEIQRSHHPVPECRIYLLGDIVEGELIFPGQSWTIDSSLYTQMLVTGPRILGHFIRKMLSAFERVRVVGVIGNHGALGGKARRDYSPESNADAMLYEVTRLVLKGADGGTEPRLEWAPNVRERLRKWYAVDTIGDHGYFLFHGDQIKGGYADYPWYAFGKKVLRWANGGVPEKFSYAFSGHFHTPGRHLFGRVRHWACGSTESSNEHAAERIGNQGTPSQYLLFAHPRRGVTAEYEVHLGQP